MKKNKAIQPELKLGEEFNLAGGALVPTVLATELPFETRMLREKLAEFMKQEYLMPDGERIRLGAVRWGVYAFFDYDNKPIYVGQTKATLSDRIGRHLTNQRTDVVAMHVLDPFEVHHIKVWPLPQFQKIKKNSPEEEKKYANAHLNALEYEVFQSLQHSEFTFLNEKDPPRPKAEERVPIPAVLEAEVVPIAVKKLRDHPDLRIARRASTLAKLAQKISEREVSPGLRRALVSQATRLLDLSNNRYNAIQDLRQRGVKVGPDTAIRDDEERSTSAIPKRRSNKPA